MTIKELIKELEKYDENMPIWVYDANDDNEPYQNIAGVEETEFGEITIYRN